jgi:hypothetical protein
MKGALFVQGNIAVNTKLTSKVPFLFGNLDVLKKITGRNFGIVKRLRYPGSGLRVPVIQLFQLRLSPEQSGKVEYERERLLGIANKFIHLLAIPGSLSRSYSTFPLCSGDNLN